MSANPIQVQGDVEQLAAVVRNEIEQARTAWRNALRHAMAAGDALNAVQPKVSALGIAWKKWLKENCFVSGRTAQLYQQLARHRDQIEAELQSKGALSLRGACQLISSARDDDDDAGEHLAGGGALEHELRNNPEEPSETLIAHWRRAPTELTALLDAIGVEGMLKAMSAEFGRQLRTRLPAPKRKPDRPFKKTLNLATDSTRDRREHRFRH